VTAQQLIELLVVDLPMNASQSGSSPNDGRTVTRVSSRPARWAAALDHGQSCALAQRRARTGLRSTYLTAASRYRSSITKEWKTLLPEMPFPALARIDHTSISAMGLPQRVP
jgi:hypothetical protein